MENEIYNPLRQHPFVQFALSEDAPASVRMFGQSLLKNGGSVESIMLETIKDLSRENSMLMSELTKLLSLKSPVIISPEIVEEMEKIIPPSRTRTSP